MSDDLQRALDELEDGPRDIVPRRALTREDVERMAHMAGREVTITHPGQPILDVDGLLIGMSEQSTQTATSAGVAITRAEADRLGIADGDIDGLTIHDPGPTVFRLPRDRPRS